MKGAIKKVIIATDRSEASDGAAKVGIDLARESGSRVAAVYVVDVTRLTHLHGYVSFLGILKTASLEIYWKKAPRPRGT